MQPKDQQLIRDQQKSQGASEHESRNHQSKDPHSNLANNLVKEFAVPSEFHEAYRQYLGLNEKQQIGQELYHHSKKYQEKVESLLSKDRNISFYSKFCDNLQIRIVKSNRESIQVGVSWGFIYCQVFVMRLGINGAHLHGDKIAGKGSFSTTYYTEHNKSTYITKSMPINYKNNSESIIQSPQLVRIITEYFISLLAGLLEIGPKVYRLFGYDIVLYNDCADYVVEVCQNLTAEIYRIEDVEAELKYGLRILHSLRICHCDIKPDNIMYCPRLQRAVFVDYGLARVIRQEIGYKTLTHFAGTYTFSGEQMRKIYLLKIQRHIDMYYNDVESVKLTLKYLQNQLTYKQEAKEFLWVEEQDQIQENSRPNDRLESTTFLPDGPPSMNINKTKNLINLLNIKLNLFRQDYETSLELMKEEKLMMRSIMVLLVEEKNRKKNTFSSIFAEFLGQMKTKISMLFNRYCLLDIQMAEYLNKYYAEQYIFDVLDLLRQEDTTTANYKDSLLKITSMLSPVEDPLLNLESSRNMREKIINTAYHYLEPNQDVQVSFLHKSHIVLIYLFYLSRKIESLKCFQNLRQAFIEIDDYISCLEVQDEIIKLVGEASLSWYYVIRMYYFVERKRWMSAAYLYGDNRWYLQILNKKVPTNQKFQLSNEQIFEDMLRNVGLQILSSSFSKKKLGEIQKTTEKISIILKTHPARAELADKLYKILNWYLTISFEYEAYDIRQTKIKIQEFQGHSWSLFKTNKEYALKNGFVNQFIYISKFQIDSAILKQFLQMLTRNNNKIDNKLQVLYQIERIVSDCNIVNTYIKIQLLRLYIETIVTIDIRLIGCSLMTVQNIIRVFIEGMRQLIVVKENNRTLKQFDISFFGKFKENLLVFFLHLMEFIEEYKYRQEIDEALFMVMQAYMRYVQVGFFEFNDFLLNKSLKLALENKKFMESDNYGLLCLLRQFKLLYQMFNSSNPLLEDLLLIFFHQLVRNSQFQIILGIPDIFPMVLSIEAGTKYDTIAYFDILLKLTATIFENKFPALVFAHLQYIYRQSIVSLVFVSSPQEIQHMVNKFCYKLSLKQVGLNYFYSILVPYIYFIALQLARPPTFEQRIRMIILSIFGVRKFRSEHVYVDLMTIIWKQVRALQKVGPRRNVDLLRKQIKTLNEQSAKKLTNLCLKNIKISKRQQVQELDVMMRTNLQKKLNRLKFNIKDYDFD